MAESNHNHELGGFLMTPAGLRLFHFLHGVEPAKHPPLAVLICSPVSGERSFSQRALVSVSRYLARQGYPTMRFDCIGTGDSEGDAGSQSFASNLQDTAAAIGQLLASTGAERVVLLGLHYGALLARVTACTDARVAGLVLVDPVISGADHWSDLLRGHQMNCVMRGQPAPKMEQLRQLPEQGMVEAKGEAYGAQWVRELEAVDLRQLAGGSHVPQLLVRYDLSAKSKATADQYAEAALAQGTPLTQWRDEGPAFWTERSLYDGYQPEALALRVDQWLRERFA